MKIKFEDHKARLIINPDYSDIDKLGIYFTEEVGGRVIKDAKLLYLAQSMSLHYGMICTYIFYEKNNETIIFSAGKNPDTNLYEPFHTKDSKESYFAILDCFDEDYEDGFFSVIHKEQQYQDLKADLPNNDINVVKRIKI
jgi:hypothetical protein